MKKPVLLLVLLVSLVLVALNSTASTLETMTRNELLVLQEAIEQELDKNHKASSAESDKVLEVTKAVTESYFEQLGIDISWAWMNYEYTKDWNFFSLKTHIDFRDGSGTKRKPDVYSEVYNQDGTYQLVYLVVGEEILLDQRAALPTDLRSSLNQNALSLASSGAKAPVVAVTPAPTIKVSAGELIKAYDNNEVAADSKYKGKLLEVSGKVSGVRTTWGKTVVDIGTGRSFEWDINCYMQSDQKDKSAQLNKGDSITIIGTCDGLSFLSVSLDDCTIKGK